MMEMFFAPKHEDPKGLHGQRSRQIIHSAITKKNRASRNKRKWNSHQQPLKRNSNRCDVTILSAQRTTSKVSIVTEMLFAPKHEDPKGLHGQWSRQIIQSVIKETELAGRKGKEIVTNKNHRNATDVTIVSAQRTTSKVPIMMEMFFAPKHEDPKGLDGQRSREIIHSAIKNRTSRNKRKWNSCQKKLKRNSNRCDVPILSAQRTTSKVSM